MRDDRRGMRQHDLVINVGADHCVSRRLQDIGLDGRTRRDQPPYRKLCQSIDDSLENDFLILVRGAEAHQDQGIGVIAWPGKVPSILTP